MLATEVVNTGGRRQTSLRRHAETESGTAVMTEASLGCLMAPKVLERADLV